MFSYPLTYHKDFQETHSSNINNRHLFHLHLLIITNNLQKLWNLWNFCFRNFLNIVHSRWYIVNWWKLDIKRNRYELSGRQIEHEIEGHVFQSYLTDRECALLSCHILKWYVCPVLSCCFQWWYNYDQFVVSTTKILWSPQIPHTDKNIFNNKK